MLKRSRLSSKKLAQLLNLSNSEFYAEKVIRKGDFFVFQVAKYREVCRSAEMHKQKENFLCTNDNGKNYFFVDKISEKVYN